MQIVCNPDHETVQGGRCVRVVIDNKRACPQRSNRSHRYVAPPGPTPRWPGGANAPSSPLLLCPSGWVNPQAPAAPNPPGAVPREPSQTGRLAPARYPPHRLGKLAGRMPPFAASQPKASAPPPRRKRDGGALSSRLSLLPIIQANHAYHGQILLTEESGSIGGSGSHFAMVTMRATGGNRTFHLSSPHRCPSDAVQRGRATATVPGIPSIRCSPPPDPGRRGHFTSAKTTAKCPRLPCPPDKTPVTYGRPQRWPRGAFLLE